MVFDTIWWGVFTFMLIGWMFANGIVWFEKTTKEDRKLWQWAYFVVFILLDVLWNWIFASIIFLQIPRHWTLSERLRDILRTDYGWRYDLAYWMCKYFIEPHDSGHCGLGYSRGKDGRP